MSSAMRQNPSLPGAGRVFLPAAFREHSAPLRHSVHPSPGRQSPKPREEKPRPSISRAVNDGQFLRRKPRILQRTQAIPDLGGAAGPDKGGGHGRLPQYLGQGHLRQALAAILRQGCQAADSVPMMQHAFFRQEDGSPRRAGICGNSLQITVRQHPLSQG